MCDTGTLTSGYKKNELSEQKSMNLFTVYASDSSVQ